jgi:predicted transcriptional regulator
MTITIDLPDELHQRLEKQAQRQGRTVPEVIARLIEEVEAAHLSAVMEQLSAEGVFAEPTSAVLAAPLDFTPIQVQGKPLSETIIEERR